MTLGAFFHICCECFWAHTLKITHLVTQKFWTRFSLFYILFFQKDWFLDSADWFRGYPNEVAFVCYMYSCLVNVKATADLNRIFSKLACNTLCY